MGWACASRAVAPIDDGNKKKIFFWNFFYFLKKKPLPIPKAQARLSNVKFTLNKFPNAILAQQMNHSRKIVDVAAPHIISMDNLFYFWIKNGQFYL